MRKQKLFDTDSALVLHLEKHWYRNNNAP